MKSSELAFPGAEAAFGMGTSVEFDSDWLTLGKHRVRLRCTRGFPSERTRSVAELAKIAVENNLSAAARLVEVTAGRGEKSYTITIGTTFTKDKQMTPHLELALATILGWRPANSIWRSWWSARRKWICMPACMSECWQRSFTSCRQYSEGRRARAVWQVCGGRRQGRRRGTAGQA